MKKPKHSSRITGNFSDEPVMCVFDIGSSQDVHYVCTVNKAVVHWDDALSEANRNMGMKTEVVEKWRTEGQKRQVTAKV